jgi:hypothetical protein
MIVTSPSLVYPGTVEIPDAFDWPVTMAAYGMMRAIRDIEPEQTYFVMLPYLIKIVKVWNINGFPEHPSQPEDIPCRPFPEIVKVLGEIFNRILEVNGRDQEVPLAPSPQLTAPRKRIKPVTS